tara:strand:+ start:286926 stop:287579 length:654 start_codon:yes stop_codon:yes gene_type:complete
MPASSAATQNATRSAASLYFNPLLLVCLLTLAGCITQPPLEPTATNWNEHRIQLQAMQQWTASGKLALRTPEQSESASMLWQQRNASTRLVLSGPVGLNVTTIESDGVLLTVTQGDDVQVLDVSSPDAIRSSTGWDLPLQALHYWLKGLPSPHSQPQAIQLDDTGTHLARLQQDSWQISYAQYETHDGLLLPGRMTITKGDTRLRIILRQWQASIAL